MNLTAAQIKALRTVADNPGKVVAWLRGEAGYLRINGNVEHKIKALGLVAEVKVGEGVRYGVSYDIKVWELTDAGRAALGMTGEDEFLNAMREGARAEGRRMGLTEEQIERFLLRMA